MSKLNRFWWLGLLMSLLVLVLTGLMFMADKINDITTMGIIFCVFIVMIIFKNMQYKHHRATDELKESYNREVRIVRAFGKMHVQQLTYLHGRGTVWVDRLVTEDESLADSTAKALAEVVYRVNKGDVKYY